MPELNDLFQSQRERLLQEYDDADQEFIAATIPYHSTRSLRFDVVNVEAGAAAPFAYAVARRGQVLRFFEYGLKDRIALGTSEAQVSQAETNMARGTSTNGAEDFVIEGVGFECRGHRVSYPTDFTDGNFVTTAAGADADVIAAVRDGDALIYDPQSIVVPGQFQSPFNLENGAFQSLLGLLSLRFSWDRKRFEPIGTVSKLPQAGAQSFLRANGQPRADNRYRIPEGYLWRRDGQTDSEFTATVQLESSLVIPISLIDSPLTPGTPLAPSALFLDVVMSVYGLSVDFPSAN